MADDEMRDGTLLYGSDGALYFIPDGDLAGYRLGDDVTARFEESRKQAEFAEVSGFAAGDPGLEFPLAIHGPLGKPQALGGEATVIGGHIMMYVRAPEA